MTRAGGITPRGLPYPGSANIHAETPRALQALATAVQEQLGSLAGGISLRFMTGTAALDGNASAVLSFPNFTIYGGIVQLTTIGVGINKPGYATAVAAGGRFAIMSANGWVALTGPDSFKNLTIGICAVAWGAPTTG